MATLNIKAFPDFRHNPTQSLVTFGLDSYIINITPIGTLTFFIMRPLGLFVVSITLPT